MGARAPNNHQMLSISSVLAWGTLNLSLLGIGAAGLPLWAHHPSPRESLAIYVLICGQILLASMLFPLLAKTSWTLAVNLALLLPMDELGGLISNLDQLSILKYGLCVAIWIAGLGAWTFLLKSEPAQIAVAALATCCTAGGAVLDYLRWEAAATENLSASFAPVSLLPAICKLHFHPLMYLQASLPIILAMIWFLVRRFTKSRSISLHNSP